MVLIYPAVEGTGPTEGAPVLATILRLALQLGPWLLRIYDLVTKLDPETRERFYELVRRWATAVKVPSRIGRIEARLDAAEVTIAN